MEIISNFLGIDKSRDMCIVVNTEKWMYASTFNQASINKVIL